MDLDPHTLQQILQRIHQQLRCPQCGKRLRVDFASVRLIVADALLLQIRCEACNAFIVLHASLQGVECLGTSQDDPRSALANASSALRQGEEEVKVLRQALEQAAGSFEQMFKRSGGSGRKTEIV